MGRSPISTSEYLKWDEVPFFKSVNGIILQRYQIFNGLNRLFHIILYEKIFEKYIFQMNIKIYDE